MAELRKVRIGDILPNPFRNLEEWPTIKEKVDEIKASFEKTGFWAGYMQVRKVKGGYEQAFGHHRLVAARELWGDDYKVEVTVTELTDDEMFARMVSENSETYGQRFYYAVMQPISSLVKAYAEGRVELGKPKRLMHARYAPSFGKVFDPNDFPYNADTVADYLGWKVSQNQKQVAATRVLIAISALELIERKILTGNDFKALNQSAAKGLVDYTKARFKAEAAEQDAVAKVKLEEARIARKNEDEKKAAALEKEAAAIAEAAEKKAVKAAKAGAHQVAVGLADGQKPADLMGKFAPKVENNETKAVKTATQVCHDLTAKAEAAYRDTDPRWVKALEGSTRGRTALAEALRTAAKRAVNRAKELEAK